MIFFMVYCFFFIFLSKFFPFKNGNMRLSSIACFLRQLSHFFTSGKKITSFLRFSTSMPIFKEEMALSGDENVKDNLGISLLDLPDLALDSILERLEPKSLCNTTVVCSSLREKCISDHMWEKHLRGKWGRLIGEAAYREWQCYNASNKRFTHLRSQKELFGFASSFWPRYRSSKLRKDGKFSPLPDDSIMAWYLALETGKFWFPAQVYNRENGNIGFVLSCYDAEVGYESETDSFKARYSPQGRSTVEYNVEWDRVRPPAVNTSAHSLHSSDCLDDLAPGDHIEIQWRRNKEFPYGWWYGVVGHLECCDGIKSRCQCHNNDTVILEFKHYSPGSRWRITEINRKEHREVGNEADGFYGGIRKLYREDEIFVWKRMWPTQIVE